MKQTFSYNFSSQFPLTDRSKGYQKIYIGAYRFTFNGKEKDSETQNQDYGMRIYDGRVGRFLSVDPLAKEFIDLAPYQFTENSPIANVDLDGLERYYTANGILIGTIGNSTEIRITNSKNTSSVANWVNAANNPPKNTDANFATRAAKYANTMSVPTFVIPTAKLETQPKTTSSSGNGKPWYDLEGSDNGGNDRVAPGGPDAAGVSTGADAVVGGGGGISISKLETPTGDAVFETSKVSVGLSLGFGTGVSAGWYTGESNNPAQQTKDIEGTGYVLNIFIISISGDISKNPDGSASLSKNWFNVGLNANLGCDFGITDTRRLDKK